MGSWKKLLYVGDNTASGAELDTGTDDVKYATAKALKDSHNIPSVAPGTAGNVLTSNGTDWISAAPSGGGESETCVVLGSDQTTQSTTYVDVTGLTFSVEANKTYIIEGFLDVGANAGTIYIACNGPASPTRVLILGIVPPSNYNVTGYDTDLSISKAGHNSIQLFILFVNGANAGTFALRFKISSDYYTATVYAGSTLRYRKVN